MRDRALMPCPAQGLRTLAAVPREQSFDPLKQLSPLVIPIPLPRFCQAEREIGRVGLLDSVERGFEFLADATWLGLCSHRFEG
jgi:hypothetical protein